MLDDTPTKVDRKDFHKLLKEAGGNLKKVKLPPLVTKTKPKQKKPKPLKQYAVCPPGYSPPPLLPSCALVPVGTVKRHRPSDAPYGTRAGQFWAKWWSIELRTHSHERGRPNSHYTREERIAACQESNKFLHDHGLDRGDIPESFINSGSKLTGEKFYTPYLFGRKKREYGDGS